MNRNMFDKRPKTITCPDCQAEMEVVEGMRDVICPNCQKSWHIPGNDSLQTVQTEFGPTFYAWIPAGWSFQAYRNDQWCSKQEPVTFELQAQSPDGAILHFFPRAWFRNTRSMNYGINPMNLQNQHAYIPLPDYVPRRIQDTFPQAVNIQYAPLPDDILKPLAESFVQQAGVHIKNPIADYGKYQFAFAENGRQYYGIFASILASKADASSQRTGMPPVPEEEGTKMDLNFFMRGGLIGAKMRNEKIAKPDLRGVGSFLSGDLWGRAMDVLLVTSDPRLYLYDQIFDDFALNINYAPGYTRAQEAELAQVQQIQLNGAMQRNNMQIQASQQLSRTISQRSDIVMSGWENRQAAQSRMSNNFSEAIRGVNSYIDKYGNKVEASVRYDHVYQKGNTYVGSENHLDPGPDWTELKRNR